MKTQSLKVKTQNYNSKGKSELKYRCYYFSIQVIHFINTLSENEVNRVILNQLIRCSTSIGANVVEAKSSSSRKDFIKFYEIALKSANETKYWFGLLRDATDTNKQNVNQLLTETEEISKMLGSSIITLKNKKF